MASRPLSYLAIEAAISAPLRQGKYSVETTIPWTVINDIRTECEKCGIDWRDVRKRMIKIRDERNQKRAGARADLTGKPV